MAMTPQPLPPPPTPKPPPILPSSASLNFLERCPLTARMLSSACWNQHHYDGCVNPRCCCLCHEVEAAEMTAQEMLDEMEEA